MKETKLMPLGRDKVDSIAHACEQCLVRLNLICDDQAEFTKLRKNLADTISTMKALGVSSDVERRQGKIN